jgi:serine/threonine-protein kinase
MTPEYWDKLQDLFVQLAGLPPDEQRARLDAECGDDDALRAELASMLRHDTAGDRSYQEAIRVVAADVAKGDEQPWDGMRVGAWRITGKIAEGGMGTVFLGERADDQFAQKAAIKLLSSGLISDSAKNRFLSERQILADLNHPNIAALLDGGTTDDGVPFLVMEFIDGRPIDRYCDEEGVTVDQRLALFKKVCRAIDFAHRNLIVHRDIKPSNILVTDDGTPKLLDFGIAKPLEPELFDHTIAVTRADLRLMTPEYASPEQIQGDPITTATDVYSLGVLLCKLLSGELPYRLPTGRPRELEQAICETEPTRPSAIPRASVLKKELSGDLDNIVLEALQKEPERRYASVRALIDDVERFEANEPIAAHPESWRYRFAKFVRRHQAGVATAAGMAVVLVSLVSFYTFQLANERDVAKRERDAAQAVTDFMVELFEVTDPSEARGSSITAREVLDRGNERIADELKDQPEIRARLLDAIGRVYYGLGLYEDARQHFGEVVALQRETGATEAAIATSIRREADATMEFGDNISGVEMLRNALEIQQRTLRSDDPEIV